MRSRKKKARYSLKRKPGSNIHVKFDTEFVVLQKNKLFLKLYDGKVWTWRNYLLILSHGAEYESKPYFEGYLEDIKSIFKFVRDEDERKEILEGFDDRKELRKFFTRRKGKLLAPFVEWLNRRKEGLCFE